MKTYEKPEIIYRDQLTTRACSAKGIQPGSEFDPAELFKDGK